MKVETKTLKVISPVCLCSSINFTTLCCYCSRSPILGKHITLAWFGALNRKLLRVMWISSTRDFAAMISRSENFVIVWSFSKPLMIDDWAPVSGQQLNSSVQGIRVESAHRLMSFQFRNDYCAYLCVYLYVTWVDWSTGVSILRRWIGHRKLFIPGSTLDHWHVWGSVKFARKHP